ncbi:MAG: hypothetical protein IJ747_02295 [Lachnospiraceae bacterium]|nr:hypothetical protein [Lachnospiraceae bacterium]
MFQIFMEEPSVSAVMFGFWGLSLAVRILLGWVYRGMIVESDNMATTNHRLLRQCKLKFANCYQLNGGVSNIPVFVDKFLNRLSLGPCSFETLYHLSGQSMLLSVVAAGAGVCAAIADGHTLGDIIPFYIVCCLELYLYFSVSTLVNLKGKKRVLKVNLVDYLENHLSARIGVTKKDMQMLYGNQRTVELMPIGVRGSREAKQPVVYEAISPIAAPAAVGAQAAVGGAAVGGAPVNAAAGAAVGGTPMNAAAGAAVGGTPVNAAAGAPEEVLPQSTPESGSAGLSPFYISEEEMEALIKEFC